MRERSRHLVQLPFVVLLLFGWVALHSLDLTGCREPPLDEDDAGDDPQLLWLQGQYYSRGDGGERDHPRALPYLREAALNGVTAAQYELGLIYESGAGVRRDPLEARRWYAMAARANLPAAQERMSFDARLRAQHLRTARIFDWTGPGPVRVRSPEDIRRGPRAPVRLAQTEDVYCDFFPRINLGGMRKFRCFMLTGHPTEGGRYYDELGNVQPAADGVLLLDTNNGVTPLLAVDDGSGRLEPLTLRDGFKRRVVRPLELRIKYRALDDPDYRYERDMYSEVAATRLLWALHYPADRMYRVRRVHCHRCPRDPFNDSRPTAEGRHTTFDNIAIELRYEAGHAEDYQPWLNGGWSWGEELHRLRYGEGPEAFTSEQKKHFDGLVLLVNVLRHVSKPPRQNRLVCLRGNILQLVGPYKFCAETVLFVDDLGSVFGKRHRDSLRRWRDKEVWKDADTCETALPYETTDEYKVERYVIAKPGQEFILGLLDQLTDEHLRALFEAADFSRYDSTLVRPGSHLPPESERTVIRAWIRGFHEKVEEIRAASCEGGPT